MPPVDEPTVRVEEPEPLGASETVGGLIEAVRPEGETVATRAVVPENPPRLLRLIVDDPDWPEKIVRSVSAVIEKSTTLKLI